VSALDEHLLLATRIEDAIEELERLEQRVMGVVKGGDDIADDVGDAQTSLRSALYKLDTQIGPLVRQERRLRPDAL